MGLFSKIWKGIKKTFKKIGKGIKKAFMKFGKFMNKIGIVGQIAMSFILPGIGGVLAKTFGNVVGALSGGALGAIGKAAGWVLGKAGEFAKMAYKGYKTVTGAITDFIGTTGKYVGGKLGIGENMSLSQAFGKEGWGGRLTDSFSELGDAAKEFWDTDIKGVLPDTNVTITKQQGPIMDETEKLADARISGDYSQLSDEAASFGEVSSPVKIEPIKDPMAPRYSPSGTPDISSGVVDSTVSSETAKAGQGLLSKTFEQLTGEKDLAGVGSAFAKRTGQYLLDVPGKALAGAAMAKINPPEVFEPSPGGGYVSQFASQTYGATQQAMQPIQPTSFGDYVQSFALGGEQQGSFLGADFWNSYMQRSLAA
jgi:hypothetical protein